MYDDLLCLLEKFSFGLLQVSFIYNGDGMVVIVIDFIGCMIWFQQWKCGILQYVINFDGIICGVIVDDNGWVGVVWDENNFQISYVYDLMGRFFMIIFLVDIGMVWNVIFMIFLCLLIVELGILVGYWKEIEVIGNWCKVIYYDVLLRLVLEEEYDVVDRVGILFQILWWYDYVNWLIYELYFGCYC